MTQILYCFHCGDSLTYANGEYYCQRGGLGLSKALESLLLEAISSKPAEPQAELNEKSTFRCVRCRSFMKSTDTLGTQWQCLACGLEYSRKITRQIVERHGHAMS